MSPRTGRPTDNPKPYQLTVRVDEEGKKILDKYTEQEGITQMEAIRRGIKKLEADIKSRVLVPASKVSNTLKPPEVSQLDKSILSQLGASIKKNLWRLSWKS